jgi:hypothetical protein
MVFLDLGHIASLAELTIQLQAAAGASRPTLIEVREGADFVAAFKDA